MGMHPYDTTMEFAYERTQQAENRLLRAPQDYVVGYAFRSDYGAVALIEKRKPAWQAGKLNGIGGKIEPGESPEAAMSREFLEEAGLLVHPQCWLHFRTEQFMHTTPGKSDQHVGTRVYHFAVRVGDSEWAQIRTIEVERIVKVRLPLTFTGHAEQDQQSGTGPFHSTVYNMAYLIPMAVTLLQQPPENRPVP